MRLLQFHRLTASLRDFCTATLTVIALLIASHRIKLHRKKKANSIRKRSTSPIWQIAFRFESAVKVIDCRNRGNLPELRTEPHKLRFLGIWMGKWSKVNKRKINIYLKRRELAHWMYCMRCVFHFYYRKFIWHSAVWTVALSHTPPNLNVKAQKVWDPLFCPMTRYILDCHSAQLVTKYGQTNKRKKKKKT